MTTPVTSTGTSAAKSTDTSGLAGKAVLGKDDFLRILVTQLRNQDPLNPMEGTEFATQLAQFSSVEQLIQMGEAMAASTAATTELKLTAQTTLGASMVGRDVLLEGAFRPATEQVEQATSLPPEANLPSAGVLNALRDLW